MADVETLPPDPPPAAPARRSPLSQTMLVLAALAIGILTARHIYADRLPRVTLLSIRVLPTQTAQPDGKPPRDVLFVAATLRIDNPRDKPSTINGLTLMFDAHNGASPFAPQVEREQLPALESAYPALTPLLGNPIFRNIRIEPGKSMQGTALFPLPATLVLWQARGRTLLTLNFNHTESVTTTVSAHLSF